MSGIFSENISAREHIPVKYSYIENILKDILCFHLNNSSKLGARAAMLSAPCPPRPGVIPNGSEVFNSNLFNRHLLGKIYALQPNMKMKIDVSVHF